MTRLGALVHYGPAAPRLCAAVCRRWLAAAPIAVLHAIVAAVLLAGCGRTPGSSGAIRFWAMGREGEVVQELVPEFERRHPGVHVRVQQIPWSAAHEKLLTAYVGDAMPDVFQLGTTWVPEFAAIGAAVPLDRQIAASTSVQAGDVFPGILEANRIDDATYGVPWYVDTRLLFYRTDLLAQAGFEAPPADWPTWMAELNGVKRIVGPHNYAILLPVREWQPLVILALQRGATLLREGDRYGDFRSAAFRAAFDFYLGMFRRALAPAQAEGQVANLYQDFAASFFAFYITGPWNIGEFSARLPASMAERWDTAPMPAPEPGQPGISIAGGASLALSRRARDPDAAWQFIEYLAEPATQIEFYRRTGDLPARRSAWSDPALADNRRAQAFRIQLQWLRSPPKVPEWERIAAKLTDYADGAVRGELTPDEALSALDRDVDALLEKRRWLLEHRS
jgi:multiple sugar transport system substrate-binding protein